MIRGSRPRSDAARRMMSTVPALISACGSRRSTGLSAQRQLYGEVLRRELLIAGFTFEGRRVPLISPHQGIHKPAVLDLPLSILTSPPSERKPRLYDDALSPDGLLLYRYRGTDVAHRDNVGLREAMRFRGSRPRRAESEQRARTVQTAPRGV